MMKISNDRRQRDEAPPTEETCLEVRLLGELAVRRLDGTWAHSATFRTMKTRHLLRLLALQPGVPRRIEPMLEQLWPDVPTSRARASLRTAACQLRRSLACPEAVVRIGDALVLERVQVDACRFEAGARTALRCLRSGRLQEGLGRALSALELYRGDLADDEPYFEPLLEAQRRLQDQLRELLLEAAGAALELGEVPLSVELSERALTLEPVCERASRLLMSAYLRLDEPGMALRVYERCRRIVADELGTFPAAATQRLHLEILASGHGEPIAQDAPRPSLPAARTQRRSLVAT